MDIALQSSVYVSSPEFAGWLLKRGFHWRKLWKPRWVALHGAEIVYMDKEPTLENSSTMTITKAQITTATVIDKEDIDGNQLGFAIHINDGHSPTWYLRAESAREKKSWLMRLNHVHAIVRWLEDFEKVKVLGVGGTGIVYELLHKTNGQRFAMKEMEIKNKAQMQMAVSEAEMLKDIMENVSHRSIMHIEKVFQVGSKFYLVFPLCTGGELYESIIKRGHFTERDAAVIIRDLVSGLHALHQQDILHLDIKPENILFDGHGADAHIKITDFGLSKILDADGKPKEQTTRFSYKNMQEKLKAFTETGDLNRDRLRGTIGYMSPELILCGHVCKGTDVFAAGVVLYILLCGRPPFNSRSNREVLEKTCKGVYTMSGAEWDDISEEAKDLVQRMLVVNPEERISTADILAHPWLKQLEEEPAPEEVLQAAAVELVEAGFSKVSTGKRKGTTNLTNALRQLSGHVKQLRSEKMATNVTRMVSLLQQGDKLKSSLSQRFLVPMKPHGEAESEASVEGEVTQSEFESTVLDPEFRSALSKAWDAIAEDQGGKVTFEQMIALIRHNCALQSGPNNALLVPLLMCRFLDRDGDGFIGADDLFAAQAVVVQRGEAFIKLMFRVYTEAVWYPGRQLNLMHLMQNTNIKGQQSAAGAAAPNNPILCKSDAGFDSSTYVVEPPKYITARHVATVFEKLGWDSSHAPTVFGILCEAINRIKTSDQSSSTREPGTDDLDEDSFYESDISSKYARPQRANPSPAPGFVSSASASAGAGTGLPPLPPSTPNAALSKAFGGDELSTTIATPSSVARPTPVTPATPAVNPSTAKMDYNDFKRAVELDDIFLHAIAKRSNQRIVSLVRSAEDRYRAVLEQQLQEVSASFQRFTTDSTMSDESGSGSGSGKLGMRPVSREVHKQRVIEEELKLALGVKSTEPTPVRSTSSSYPIASAVGRATFAALGLAAKVTSNLMEATMEATEDPSPLRSSDQLDKLEYRNNSRALDSDDDEDDA